MINDKSEKIKAGLKPDHVIHTMISEHEKILGFLDELERINESFQKKDIDSLKKIAEHLLEAESHHQREEEVLFPKLEKRDFSCAPEVMREEHKELRQKKKELVKLVNSKIDFETFKKKLNNVVNFIVPTLREHIFKENNILYPMALQIIPEDYIWLKIKEKCDKIGYCCFTPKILDKRSGK